MSSPENETFWEAAKSSFLENIKFACNALWFNVGFLVGALLMFISAILAMSSLS